MLLFTQSENSVSSISKRLLIGMVLGVSPILSQAANDGSAITAAELQQKGYSFPTDLVAGANQTQFANYAWRLFIASMQNTTATLTDGTARGTPSASSNFIDSGKATSFNSPLVFESLYHRTEAFPFYQSASQKPASPIGKTPKYYTYYKNAQEQVVPYTVTGQYVNLDETNEISQNFLYYRQSNAPDFPVLFMAKVNALETNYVWDKTAPSNSSSFVFPNTVMEVKTAWRRVSDIKNSKPSHYHQAQATYYKAGSDGVPHQVTEKFALIAIHIIQKTANYQQFIFTTFEHVDAVTRDNQQKITDPAYQLTYDTLAYDSGNTKSYTAIANGAYDINAPGQTGQSNQQKTYQLPDAGPTNAGPDSGNYVVLVQPKTITSEVNDVNNQVAGLILGLDASSVWANYRLKGVQAVPTSDQTSKDYYLANIVVESSQPGIQLFRGGANGGVPVNGVFTNNRNDGTNSANVSLGLIEGRSVPPAQYTMGGCQGCHGRAQQKGRDFSFLAQASGGKGKELDSVPAAALSASAARAHNKKMARKNKFY